MALRICTDRAGIAWEVFEVHPSLDGRRAARVPASHMDGWLCFQSATERRRLVPIPTMWQAWDDDTLLAAIAECEGTRRRTPASFEARNSGAPRVEPGEPA